MSIVNNWEEITIKELLKADPFGEEMLIQYPNKRKPQPIMSKKIFFDKIYADVEDNQIKVTDGAQKKERQINLDKWMENLNQTSNSRVVFIEGYAGCGKSVFVQYLLKEQLKTLDYKYNYYNYDIGSYYDNRGASRIKDAIRECFLQQLSDCIVKGNIQIIKKFEELLGQKEIKYIDNGSNIFYQFSGTNAFRDAVRHLRKDRDEENFRIVLHEQIRDFRCEQILALDYVYRIARYIILKDSRILYVCYDNMDSIENFEELSIFDNTLISMRHNIDCYINKTLENFEQISIPRFVILATYRKITAARVELATHSERHEDFSEDNRFVQYLDACHLYNYQTLIHKRKEYFVEFFRNERVDKMRIFSKLDMSVRLSDVTFVQKRYAGLWNNNYRTCSDILYEILQDHESEIEECLYVLDKKSDGYSIKQSAYFGASSIFLRIVCEIFQEKGLWDENHLNLIPLKEAGNDAPISKLTSLSRLILTYISNVKDEKGQPKPVSAKDLFKEFEGLYPPKEICVCLANMLTRDKTGTWRRPIYYHRYAINDDQQIIEHLNEQCIAFENGDMTCKYTEFLLCECGYAYINRMVSEFEFFSVRKNNKKSLYLTKDLQEMKEMIKKVYNAVECCCKNMVVFREHYMKEKNMNNIKDYIKLHIHPKTNKDNPQMHTERIIFSHIAYLNDCRLYLIKQRRIYKEKEEINELFIDFIIKYLGLYDKYIKYLNADRNSVAKVLSEKADKAKTEKLLYLSIKDD